MSSPEENVLPVKSEEKSPVETVDSTTSSTEKESSKENLGNITKRKRVKRTSQEILAELNRESKPVEKKQEPEKEAGEEEAPAKRQRVTREPDEEDSEGEENPSLWRGAVAKPLLLAGLGGLSFFVNHWFKTTVPKKKPPPHTPAEAVRVKPSPQQKSTLLFNKRPSVRPHIQGFT